MSWVACVALASLCQLPLERWRPHLDQLEERTATGEWAVPDETVRQLERDLGALLALPDPWSIELRPPADSKRPTADIERSELVQGPRCERLRTHVVGRFDCVLELSAAFDLQSIALDALQFVALDGATPFTRAEFAEQHGFLPPRALPIVLSRLDEELRALPLDGLRITQLQLESSTALLRTPSIRCWLGLCDASDAEAPGAFSAQVCGEIALPASAVHDEASALRSASGTSDAGSVPRMPSRLLANRVNDALAPLALRPAGDVWRVLVFGNVTADSWRAYVELDDGPMRKEFDERWLFEVLGRRHGTLDSGYHLELTLGNVLVSNDAARAILTALHTERDTEKEIVFSLTGCATTRAIDVVFTPRTVKGTQPTSGRGLRFRLSNDGAIEHRDAFTVREISSTADSERREWICTLGDGAKLALSLHKSIFCWTDEDMTPRARLDDEPLGISGGAVERELLGGY